jgi:heme-degrading monooxygenase HmoA
MLGMFGTIMLLRPKTGQEEAVLGLMDDWARERAPRVKGFVASYLYRNEQNPKELIGVVVFDSREDYFANADDPEQDRWYRRLVEHLEEEPRFIDGEVLARWPR